LLVSIFYRIYPIFWGKLKESGGRFMEIGNFAIDVRELISVTSFKQSPRVATVEPFQGQSRRFVVGQDAATWGASLLFDTTVLPDRHPDTLVGELLGIELAGEPVAITYGGIQAGEYFVSCSVSEIARSPGRTAIEVALIFEGTTTPQSPTRVTEPRNLSSPWALVAKINSQTAVWLEELI
jgi:hypothetical protein